MKKFSFIICILFLSFIVYAQQPWIKSSPLNDMWMNVGNLGFSPGGALNINLVFNPIDNQPYVTYVDENSWLPLVMEFNGTNWMIVGSSNISPRQAFKTCLAFSSSGQPFLAFGDDVNGNKATVVKLDGNNWVYIGNEGFQGSAYTDLLLSKRAEQLSVNDYVALTRRNSERRFND